MAGLAAEVTGAAAPAAQALLLLRRPLARPSSHAPGAPAGAPFLSGVRDPPAATGDTTRRFRRPGTIALSSYTYLLMSKVRIPLGTGVRGEA